MTADPTAQERQRLEALMATPPERNGQFAHGSGCLDIFDLAKLDGPAPPDQKWIVPDYIPAGEITLFTGYGGAGKSLLAQQLSTCIASGAELLGLPIERKRVLYVTAEDSEDVLHRRQLAIMSRLNYPNIGNRLMLASIRGRSDNALNTPANVDGTGGSKLKTDLHNTIIARNADVVILDNIAHLFAGNENDRGEVTRFINDLYGMVKRLSVTILLIGHPNKAGDSYSGSTAWLAAVRSQIEIARPEEAIDPDARVLRLGKANYARAGREVSFRWHEGAFARDDELPRNVMAEIREVGRMNGDDDAFLACLAERNRQERPVSEHPSANYAPKVFERMKEAKGIGKQRLTEAMDRLFRSGKIRRDVVGRDKQRRPKEGIVAVADMHQTPASNAHQTLAQDRIKPSVQTASQTHHIPKGILGAGPDGPRPPETGFGGER